MGFKEGKKLVFFSEIVNVDLGELFKQVFQIIAHDSAMHRKVQEFIVDTLEKEAITLTPEELADIWSLIEEHIAMERATVLLGEQAKAVTHNFVHKYLLNYLLADEHKHDVLLEQLENIKNKLYPYA